MDSQVPESGAVRGREERSPVLSPHKVASNLPKRQRLRCWVFTIHTDFLYNDGAAAPRGGPNSPDGGQGDSGSFWDPNTLSWDPNSVRYVICGLEECPETKRLHWQGYIEVLRAMDLSSVKKSLNCAWAHLEARRGNQEQAIAYCRKDESGVSDDDGAKILFEWGTPAVSGSGGKSSKNDNYHQVLTASTYQEAVQLCQELEPADYVRFRSSIRRGLMEHFMTSQVFIRPIETFCQPRIDEEIIKRKAVVLTGLSGAGKTAFALAHFQKPKMVSHIDDLKEFNPLEHDGLVFDDMSFGHWPVTSCIHIIDMEYDRTINCRYQVGFIPSGFPRFFTSNLPLMKVFNYDDANEEQCNALSRRVHHVIIENKLF